MTKPADNFIYEVTLIDPLSDIISRLENNEFRDCDIEWLNIKLKAFTSFALETLGMKFELDEVGSTVLNQSIKSRFLNHFKVLLEYFKNCCADC